VRASVLETSLLLLKWNLLFPVFCYLRNILIHHSVPCDGAIALWSIAQIHTETHTRTHMYGCYSREFHVAARSWVVQSLSYSRNSQPFVKAQGSWPGPGFWWHVIFFPCILCDALKYIVTCWVYVTRQVTLRRFAYSEFIPLAHTFTWFTISQLLSSAVSQLLVL
jgi:hypothetical protein